MQNVREREGPGDALLVSQVGRLEGVHGNIPCRSMSKYDLPRKEVIQPQVLLRLPCYDFTPITIHTLGIRLLFRLAKMTLGTNSSHGVTGGVYKVRERIHRVVMIRDY